MICTHKSVHIGLLAVALAFAGCDSVEFAEHQEAGFRQGGAKGAFNGLGGMRKAAAVQMEKAAADAGVSIETSKMVISTTEGVIAAMAPTLGDPAFDVPLALVYHSFPEAACADTIPEGFYTVEAVGTPTLRRALYRDLDGVPVADFPIEDLVAFPNTSVAVKLVSSDVPVPREDIVGLWRVKPPGGHWILDLDSMT